ncbi:ABC transporter substrate-binding protein [Halorubellus sp. JP-L1]|uniref:ABC transporter substrate-binding protein n=1 Tax=Halorubellus sp. JP-L1 TaxID=2715753 RepID=UPI00140E8609|nr:ABC transporter substrate-binding protein [Halorubellus sp. JP-L1]NHN41581.1 ABC transporter substrate-binding protein [Halorubellus sp. JP-L1]
MADGDNGMERRDFLKTAGATAAAATTTATAGCISSLTGGSGGSLVYARGDHPENYDPQQTTSGEVAKVTNQIFDTLIQFQAGSGGQLTDGLAKSDGWSLSGTTATLELKEDVTFHDGSDFTAADVKATIRRFTDENYDYYLGTENASGYAGFTFGNWVDEIDASSEYTVEFTLTQKYAPFLRNLAMFAAAILNQDQITGLDDQTQLGTEPNGTGPFAFEELDNSNQRVLLSANNDYWGEGPNVGEVVFKTIGQNSSRAQDVVNGDSHITDNLGAESSTTIEEADTAQIKSKPGINSGYMAFNMARKEEFRDRRVRRAVSLAVNTEAVVNTIYQGFAVQSSQPLPQGVMGRKDDLDPYPNDKEQAQSLLEEAGAADMEFELATFSNPRGYNPSPIQTANQFKSDLEEIGLTVNINQFSTFSSYLEYTDAGNHDACFLGWYTDNADPDNFMYVLLDPKVEMDAVPDGQDWVSRDTEGYSVLNAAGWANTDYMQLVRDAQSTYDEATRKQKYQQASQIAHDEAPWVFVDYAKTIRAIHESVVSDSFTVSSVGGPFLELVELE